MPTHVSDRMLKQLFIQAANYIDGQDDRKAGRPALSTNGTYLDGWYSPDEVLPPMLTSSQYQTFLDTLERSK